MNMLSGPILHQLIGVLSYPSIYMVSYIPGGDHQTSATSNSILTPRPKVYQALFDSMMIEKVSGVGITHPKSSN